MRDQLAGKEALEAKELQDIVQYGFKLAEEASNIPLISQGQTGPQDPQTFGQAELQNNNADTLLRGVVDSFSTVISTPSTAIQITFMAPTANITSSANPAIK